jgi:hypothetical protein
VGIKNERQARLEGWSVSHDKLFDVAERPICIEEKRSRYRSLA